MAALRHGVGMVSRGARNGGGPFGARMPERDADGAGRSTWERPARPSPRRTGPSADRYAVTGEPILLGSMASTRTFSCVALTGGYWSLTKLSTSNSSGW